MELLRKAAGLPSSVIKKAAPRRYPLPYKVSRQAAGSFRMLRFGGGG